MPRLRCDDNASAALHNDIAELFQHEGSAIKVDLEDRGRRGLRRRDASGMDQAGHALPRAVAVSTSA